jgi:hypothetical protein
MAFLRPPLQCRFGAVCQGGCLHGEGKGSRITGTTREGTRLGTLKTGGMLHVGMGRLERGWPGLKRERALEAQRERPETAASGGSTRGGSCTYRLWALSFSLGMAMLGG